MKVHKKDEKVKLFLPKIGRCISLGEAEVRLHAFLSSALHGGEWSASRPGRFTPGKKTPVHIQEVAGVAPETVWAMWRNFQVTSY